MLWVAATFGMLVVLYLGLRASIGEHDTRLAPQSVYAMLIAAPQPGEAMTVLPVRQNETVTLSIRSDRAGDVHVHGYDQNVTLKVGAEVVLSFVAKTPGIYPIHLHEKQNPADPNTLVAHRQVAVLEVKEY
ncbi:cupredoxin domain-containing protein [Peristeroidobacter agariperforans]|uniref:hypothetical protein n=1 Tax=Peristeroidobacter agariperforans TaxID=268404 RepID=UPI00101C13C5|nr:hypothetical protein [Peristeroidobacter agariperforans]